MKISLNWLGRYVDLSGLEPRRIALDLTMGTAETEGLHRFGAGIEGVVIGHVVSCAKHPEADKLSLTKVDFGAGEAVPVVCGAPNVRAGQKVAFAPIGTKLPGDLEIKKAKIRGAESFGMICSEKELGLSDENAGILVLEDGLRAGAKLLDAVPEASDWVIEIDNKSVTHRPDLWGHYGFARELAAIYGRELRPYPAPEPVCGSRPAHRVRIDDDRGCSRYVALCLDGVFVERSPRWLRYLLAAVGQRSISNLVDLSNFVMLDLGQPNHSFDAAKLSAAGIVVRRAKDGETMATLDGALRQLTRDDLLICDGEAPVAIAGVMGGGATEVGPETTRVLLESACFDPVSVRRTAQRLALRTDASARFEKSLDPTQALDAAYRFAALARELCPQAQVSAAIADVGAWKRPGTSVGLSGDLVRKRLGSPIADERIVGILESLGFQVREEPTQLVVDVPTWRATKDVSIAEDLVEEVGRMVGYDNISPVPHAMPLVPPHRDEERLLRRRAEDVMAALGFSQALNYSFVTDEILAMLGEDPARYVEVLNPIAVNASRLRREGPPSLLANLLDNLRREPRVALFEVGKGYQLEHLNERAEPRERHWLAAVLATARGEDGAPRQLVPGPFYALKGVLDELCLRLDAPGLEFEKLASGAPAWAHPARCARILRRGRELGLIAEAHPGVLQALGIEAGTAIFDLDLRALLGARDAVRSYVALPRFPSTRLDVAVAAPRSMSAAALAALIREVDPAQVGAIEPFDVYEGASVGEGRRSLAFHVELLSLERTLGEKDVARFLERLARALDARGAELRRD
ncbi:MAG: phenylalanine--tRNA ligase subunit beta [Planctomycetes bacterium]|nr:phenylalanine--tRNA ligase subunit beta [Planctomycetota bacterium]